MGKTLLLAITLAVITAMSVLMQVNRNTMLAGAIGESHASRLLAREIAITGINHARHSVLAEFDSTGTVADTLSFAGNYRDGSYTGTVSRVDTLLTLESTGFFNAQEYHYLEQYVFVPATSKPLYTEYAIACSQNMNINSGITLTTADSMNASIFANGQLHVQSSSHIEGFAFTADAAGAPRRLDENIFQPNVNPDGEDVIQTAESIPITSLDPLDFVGLATQTTTGQITLGGTYSLGTAEAPTVWYIDGNVSTNAPVTFTGHGAVIVNGNMTINHDIYSDLDDGANSLGLYVSNGITVSARALDLSGHWYVNQAATISSRSHFSGSLTIASTNCGLSRPITMHYYPPSSTLLNILMLAGYGGETEPMLEMHAVLEW